MSAHKRSIAKKIAWFCWFIVGLGETLAGNLNHQTLQGPKALASGMTAFKAGKKSPKPLSKKAQILLFLDHRYMNTFGFQVYRVPFLVAFGSPQKARRVLIAFTSLSCPMCSIFHNETLPRLEEVAKKDPSFAIIIRDYPTDKASLFASARLWALKTISIQELMSRSFKEKWVTETSWAPGVKNPLKGFEQHIQTRLEKEYDKTAEAIFYERKKDIEALGLTEVPKAFLIDKGENFSHSGEKESDLDPSIYETWSLKELNDPNDWKEWCTLLKI